MSEKIPLKWGLNYNWWLRKEYFLQWVGVKGRVCWCECWQIARRCRTVILHLRLCGKIWQLQTSFCVQTYSLKDAMALLKFWPCEYVSTVERNDYGSITEYRVHLIWSMHSMFDLHALNVCQILYDWAEDKQQHQNQQPPQWIGILDQCDKMTHSSSKEKNWSVCVLTHSWWKLIECNHVIIFGRNGDLQVDKENSTAWEGGKEDEHR